MKTIKLPIQNTVNFDEELRLFNSVMRYSYNRFKDGLNEKDVRAKVNQLFSGNCWFLQSSLKEGKAVFDRNKENKVVFGGRFNLKQYLTGKISKDEYKAKKLAPITIQGEAIQKGNRLFDFDFTSNKITYKPSKTNHIEIELPKLRSNLKKEFIQLQSLTDDKKQRLL